MNPTLRTIQGCRLGWVLTWITATLLAAPGCGLPPRALTSAARYESGMVFVLPGIEGHSAWNRDLAVGLAAGGVRSAIEVHDWTTGLPGGYLFNLADLERNRAEAARLAEKIYTYQRRHPQRAVHLIGHSGGGGLAVLTLEALPAGVQVDAALLLGPALSPGYDLSPALARVEQAIHNFYSERDVSFLKLGTSLYGTIDREYAESAGAVGFVPPGAAAPAAVRTLYAERLRQTAWDPELGRRGASGTHLGWASRRFAAEYLAPLIRANERRKLPPGRLAPLEF